MSATVAPSSGNLSVGAEASWWKQFFTQFWALACHKTARVAIRNRRATLLRLVVAPFLFILLTFIVTKGLDHTPQNRAYNSVVQRRAFSEVQAIPDCTTDLYYVPQFTQCFDLLYSPDGDNDINGVVNAIRQNNPGRPISADRVLAFASREESNTFLLQDLKRRANGALHFAKSGSAISFTLQTNSSVRGSKGLFQDRTFWSQVPIQVAAEREISRYNFARAGLTFNASEWKVATSGMPHPSLAEASIDAQILGPFTFASNMFGFVLLIAAVVGERELKLRQALRTMGLQDASYWLSWAAYEVVMAAVTAILLCAFGSAFQFNLFFNNSFGLPFLLFFLFQLAMSSTAMLFSVFCKTSSSAVTLGFVIFIIGWIMQLIVIFGFPYSPQYLSKDKWAMVVFALFPWSDLVKATNDLGMAVLPGSTGIHWANRKSYCQNLSQQQIAQQPATSQYRDYQCVLSLNSVYWILLAEWVVYFFLAIYLDNVLPNENGLRRPFYYIFTPNFWRPSRRRNFRHRPGMAATAAGPQFLRKPIEQPNSAQELDDDVAAEQAKTQDLLGHRIGMAGNLATRGEGLDSNAFELFGLQKVFKGPGLLRKWISRRRSKTTDFWAVKGSWFTIADGELFCLLGANGCGKSTTINLLTGVVSPTAGDALIHGEAISSPGGLDRARRLMGVCPQFDILWQELTGREHMLIYASVKGLPRKAAVHQADELLAKVQLSEAANQRTGSYSGGMRRRLSVAIALLGDPKIIFLDEPTTGMDPIARRHVWDIIEEAKKGRAVILTTHSMEEADVLGDRIAIMAKGSLKCIGSSLRLKQKFGAGYQLTISHISHSTAVENEELLLIKKEQTRDRVKQILGLAPSDETGAYIQYLVPRESEETLPKLLSELEFHREDLGIKDINIRLTSLEEVFLTIARQAEMEAAETSGNVTQPFPLPDGTNLKVQLGAEEALHPITSEVYNIKWAQDDSGALQILDAVPSGQHKRETSSEDSGS